MKPMELWGGVECTINRVGNRYFNQLKRSGHWSRADEDLERFAALGLRTLRFPILWEAIAPDAPDKYDWSWTDARLARLDSLGIRPIAGLLHHGSGPRYTGLVDPDFPEKFAAFAAAVAQRYPSIEAYTPINEPVTTARFSGLYGHWFPHGRSDKLFVRALLNQCRAIALAMEEIRKVNARAILVQTDDLGKTSSTLHLRYQADFENERRWLGWDLLRGDVSADHAMWDYLVEAGADLRDLHQLIQHPSPPDVIGLNYYVTSERYLDEEIENYPPELHGENRSEVYADDAAVRSSQDWDGFDGAIKETYARYHLPIALTEVQLGCTADEQVRWFFEAWQAALRARANGIDVLAVTAWALLGSFDWDSLVTQSRDSYEAGVFSLSDGPPTPTPLSDAIAQLTCDPTYRSPYLASPGWWRSPVRVRHCIDRLEPELKTAVHAAVGVRVC